MVAERVTYVTEYGLRVPAIVYRPEKIHGKIPGIVVVNGHGADKTSWYSWYTGVEYARAGAMVLTYDMIGEGERNDDHKDGTSEHDKLIDVPGVPQRMGGQMVTDVMQAVSYLQEPAGSGSETDWGDGIFDGLVRGFDCGRGGRSHSCGAVDGRRRSGWAGRLLGHKP